MDAFWSTFLVFVYVAYVLLLLYFKPKLVPENVYQKARWTAFFFAAICLGYFIVPVAIVLIAGQGASVTLKDVVTIFLLGSGNGLVAFFVVIILHHFNSNKDGNR